MRIYDGPDWVSPSWVARNPDHHVAQSLIRAFRTKWNRSSRRCPPGFYVGPNGCTFNSYVVDVHEDALGRLKFGRDYFTNARPTRALARGDAWDWYEEIWDKAHKALSNAGAFGKKEN